MTARNARQLERLLPVGLKEISSPSGAQAADATRSARDDDILSFEQLFADLSAGFVNLPAARIDGAITEALRRVVGLLGVDRCNLIRFSQGDGTYVTHSWSVEGVPAVVPRSITNEFPWVLARVRAGNPVVVARLADLPAEAAADEAAWRGFGVKSNLTVPMTIGGRIEGAIAIASLWRERQWPEHLVSRLRALADVFGNALAHKRAQEGLDTAMAFERLVSDLLVALLTAGRAEDKDPLIKAGLRDMALILGADRATLWERIGNSTEFGKTHRWLAENVPIPPDRAGGVAVPWISARLAAGEVVRFANYADLPPEAQTDLPVLRELGVRSLVIVPLTVSGVVVRALSLATAHEEREWPEALVPRVKLLGEVFASVLARDEAERREREAKAQAAHAVRVGAMGAFAASLAHELTQPVAASLSNAETAARLLAAPDPDVEELRATLEDIVADDRRASDLIQKLRRFLRRGEMERGELAMHELLDEVVHLAGKEALGRGIALRVEAAEVLPKVWADQVQIQQVMLNLLSNAFDAVAQAEPASRQVAVHADQCGDGVSVEVRDSGAGMDEQTLARIFQPLFTTKPKGMGLGLSISRTIVEAHGGTLSVRSAPGKGTTFRIELPARPAGEVRPTKGAA